jgi:predicted NBD/HSP70 family sugar kinase
MTTLQQLDQKGSKNAILQMLHKYGALTRIRLSDLTNLSRATISTAVSELIQLGLVKESKEKLTTGGRPAVTLKLVPDSKYIIGADLDPEGWTIVVFDLSFKEITTQRIALEDKSIKFIFNAFIGGISKLIKDFDKRLLPIIGVGLPGIVNSKSGTVISAAHLNWSNIHFAAKVREEIGWETAVLNHNKARGLAECRYGAGKNRDHIVYIGIGNGVAGGIFYDRKLVTGAMDGAGEIGHTTIVPDGVLCNCGKQGCLQAYVSGSAIELQARKMLREDASRYYEHIQDVMQLKYDEVCRAADAGDTMSVRIVKEAARYLGISMANLVNILNPEMIILGGTVPNHSQLFVQTAAKVMQQMTLNPLADATDVKVAAFNQFGGALGAANFAMDEHFSYSLCMELIS